MCILKEGRTVSWRKKREGKREQLCMRFLPSPLSLSSVPSPSLIGRGRRRRSRSTGQSGEQADIEERTRE